MRRDQDFLDRFCQKGVYIDKLGKEVRVCQPIDANDILNFLHEWDAVAKEELAGK